MSSSFFQTALELELRASDAGGVIFFLDCSDSSSARNQTISGAIPVPATIV